MLNDCKFMGRFVADPELRKVTVNGDDVSTCTFRIAVQRPYNKNAETQMADFITCVVWRGLADLVCNHFKKGNRILVGGSMHTRTVKNEESDTSRTYTELAVNYVDFVDLKKDNENQTNDSFNYHETTNKPVDTSVEADEDDNLPF